MKLLVTGGAGFIGSNFIRYWITNHPHDEITNFDVLTYAGNLESLEDVSAHHGYTFTKGDICNSEEVAHAMRDVDVIVHFAAESHVDRSIERPATFILTNIVGTQILLEAALKFGIKRFHHISTDEVFGSLSIEGDVKFSESSPYNPRSPYSASKASSDHLVRAYYHTYRLPITITNCSNNFGPYQFPEKFIPLAITSILEGKKVPIYGDGKYIRDWLYVEDHCRAIELVLNGGAIGQTYCIGGMTNDIDNISVVQRIMKIMDVYQDQIVFVSDRPGHDRKYAVDWTKIQSDLGWKPLHDFDTYLQMTIDWYKSHSNWWKRVKSDEYNKKYEGVK